MTSRSVVGALVWLMLSAGPLPAGAQDTQPTRQTLDVPRAQAAPRLEDFVAGEPDAAVPGVKVTGFLQRDPGDLTPVSEPTEAYLSYDATSLHVVFVCRAADPSRIRAHMARRESMFSDDHVGLFLDTFNDRQRSYMFFVSPLGIQGDGVATEGQMDDMSFDALWHSRGRLTDFGYVVSMSIPFKSLRFPPGSGPRTWGLALVRYIPVNNEQAFWPGITRKVNSFVSQFAEARGFDGVSPGRNIQLIPYGTFTGARFLENGAIDRQADGRAGIDAKIVLRDAFTVDLTANPDFSQVESDEPQVTVNQRFEVFFPEKRPFFLENSNYFQTPINLFFSRRIGDPQWGVRATGKAGGWAAGAMAIDDRAPGRGREDDDPLGGDHAANVLVRARREIGESSIGGMATSRAFGSSANRVVAADTRIKLNPRWYFDGQAAVSDTEPLSGNSLRDTAYYASLTRGGRKFYYNLSYADVGPDFRSQLGFIPRTDMRQAISFFNLRWYPKNSPIQSFGPNSYVQATWDRKGELQDWLVRYPFEIAFTRRTVLFVRHARAMERFGGFEFDQHENLLNFFTSYLSWLDFYTFVSNGTRPNFFPGPGRAPSLANFQDASAGVTLRPTAGLLLDQTYLYSRLTGRPENGERGTIFDNHIFRTRVNYQFTRELSIRGILDYNGVLANSSLVALDRTKHLTADVLMTYLVNPGTALYIGYTDGYDNVALEGSLVRLTRSPTTSTGRQFFVKTSYLFRF